ncbi:ATPase with chaperone activity [Stieleria sp. TO1_6]|uniref:ATPase with chaperone activity n=1 Tax=Stieleria tagensis TaxID=2956795 RepID=UPI00209B98FE|nr:ATPase with chaperone activity [Stieleria tagensis]MCO8125305.1 ATPase with chaperone activity [Stieleria tagensis]
MPTTPANTSSDGANADSQLDSLISRIQSLTGGGDQPAKQQPRRAPSAPGATPPADPAAEVGSVDESAAVPASGGPQPALQAPVPQRPPQPPPKPTPSGIAEYTFRNSSPQGPVGQAQSAPPPPTLPPSPHQGSQTTSHRSKLPAHLRSAPASSTATPGPKAALGYDGRDIPAGPLGFKPSRDEVWRPVEPESMEQAGINESILEAIIYRYLLTAGEAEGRKISDQVKVPFRLIEPILIRLKMEQHVGYRSATATNDYVYVLTESGRQIARNHSADCTYFGACPVRLDDYVKSVRYQTIEGQYPKKADLIQAFSDLLINPKMLNRLGPAVASGRGMFLFGFPGNGKTSIAERVTGAFGKYIWIPRCVDVDGDVLRVFDPMNHELAPPEEASGLLDDGGIDKRWVRIKRPTIIAGGELTMEMLEVLNNPDTNISESPLQLKSNCGTLVIDDFGRQKMRVDELLNRWIVPLEKRYDFMNMASGKKIQVPFDQLVIFSTNLEPKDLVDDAFLRRIPYKIEVENPPEQDFRKLFEIMCRVTKMPYNADAIDYLIQTHYIPVNRPYRNCQPRDLLLQVKNYCMYNDLEVELKNEYFDFACDNYFSVM